MKATIWLNVSALALTWCGVANAQATGVAAEASKASVVQEVVVTAERRATNLQTTAVAATVLTGADLQARGITSVDQLQLISPSLTVQNFGQGNDFNIRGIGKGESNSQTGVGVVTYRDGVASFPGYFQDEPYYDIADIEILRGPQGTFAGQNATGGAVFITETNPSFNGVHGYIAGQYGNYNDGAVQGAVNLPISDTLAVRLAFNDEYRGSFYQITGKHTGNPGLLKESNARLSVLWKPTANLTVSSKTDYNYIDQGGYAADPVNSTNDLFKVSNNAANLAIDQFVRSVLRVDYTFAGGIILRSISGYQQGRTAEKADLDGSANLGYTFSDAADEQIYSQEIDLISPSQGPLTWVAGGYYQNNRYRFPTGPGVGLTAAGQTVPSAPFNIGYPPGIYNYYLWGTNVQKTAAGFAQISWDLSSRFQIQIGARYTYSDTVNRVGVDSVLYTAYPGFTQPTLIADNQSLNESRVTGKVALNWKLDDDNFVYAFVATGHKAGGLNVPVAAGQVIQPFKGENVTDYEIGWKANAFDRHVKTQLGAYYDVYDNFQATIGNPINPVFKIELNVPNATKIYGVEGSAQAVFGPLSFDAGASVLHSSLGAFFAVDPRTLGVGACDPSTGPVSAACQNLTGHRQDYAPNFTLNLGVQYAVSLPGGDTLTPRVNFSHVSQQWATLFETTALGDSLPERNLLSAQVAWSHRGVLVTAYAYNLTDQHYVTQINSGLRFAGAPRQFGVRAVKFF